MIKKTTINSLGTIITGNTPPRNHPELYGDYTPFFKATDITEGEKYTYSPEEYYSKEGFQKYHRSLIPKGSTCVVTIGSIGKKMTMAHCDCFINQAMNAIVPNESFDQEFVWYAVKNVLSNIKSLDSGTASGRENVSKSSFSKMEVIINDDKDTQIRIARVLKNYDDLIENYQKQIKLLEEAAQRIYKEWFVDFHFPGHENVKIVNGVPEGWEKMKLGDIAYESGQKISKKSRNAYDYYLPIDCLPKQSLTYIQYNPIEEAESSLVSFKKNDIIFGAMRPYFHKVVFAQSRGVTRTTCFVLNSIKSDYWGYLLVLLFSEETIKYAAKISVGTTMPYVRWKDFSNMEIIKPSLFVAQKIQFIMSSLINQLTLYSKQVRLLIEARDRLLPKLMSGEIEV